MTVEESVRETGHTGLRTCPLTDSIGRVDAVQERVRLTGETTGEGWIRCSELLRAPHRFEDWWTTAGDWLRATYGEAPQRTTIAYVMSWYLRIPAYTGAAMLFHERRVPTLRPDRLALRIDTRGRPGAAEVAVLGSEFACLPGDPASGDPNATVVDDERALAHVLRTRYISHAAKFVRAYRSIAPMGTRTLWSAATDALDNCLWWAGRDCDDEGAGVADATLVLPSTFTPLTAPSTLHVGDHGWQRHRHSCCFTYLLPGREECTGCPRRPR